MTVWNDNMDLDVESIGLSRYMQARLADHGIYTVAELLWYRRWELRGMIGPRALNQVELRLKFLGMELGSLRMGCGNDCTCNWHRLGPAVADLSRTDEATIASLKRRIAELEAELDEARREAGRHP